jgi:hypothetical protein
MSSTIYIYINNPSPSHHHVFGSKKIQGIGGSAGHPCGDDCGVSCHAHFSGRSGELMGKYMGNIWKIYGKYIGNIWKIYGKIWEILCFYGWVSIWFLSSNYGRDSPAMFD